MGVYYRSVTTLGQAYISQGIASLPCMIHPLQIFWHSTLRLGRIGFLAGAAALAAALAGIDLWVLYGLPKLVGLILTVMIGYSAMCVLSLRLHDRGRSGWWGWLVLLLISAVWPLTRGGTPDVPQMISLAMLGVVFIDLALMPGQKGLNRYGPPPKG